jgi:hypothetical protein
VLGDFDHLLGAFVGGHHRLEEPDRKHQRDNRSDKGDQPIDEDHHFIHAAGCRAAGVRRARLVYPAQQHCRQHQ